MNKLVFREENSHRCFKIFNVTSLIYVNNHRGLIIAYKKEKLSFNFVFTFNFKEAFMDESFARDV